MKEIQVENVLYAAIEVMDIEKKQYIIVKLAKLSYFYILPLALKNFTLRIIISVNSLVSIYIFYFKWKKSEWNKYF